MAKGKSSSNDAGDKLTNRHGDVTSDAVGVYKCAEVVHAYFAYKCAEVVHAYFAIKCAEVVHAYFAMLPSHSFMICLKP
jgi:hypothetical protein